MGVVIMNCIAVIVMRRGECRMQLQGLLLLLWIGFALTGGDVWAKTVSQSNGNLQLDSSHGNGEGWGKSKCSSCHALQRLHQSVPTIKTMVDQKKFATCTGCHGSNGTRVERQCIVCHNQNDLPQSPVRGGRHRHDFNAVKDLKTTSQQCVVCHQASDMDGRFELDRDLTQFDDSFVGKQSYANSSEFCLRCHNLDHQQAKWPIRHAGRRDQSQRAEDHYRNTDAHGVMEGDGDGLYSGLRTGQYAYKTVVDCVDCHTLHGTQNSSLLIENSRQGLLLLDEAFRKQNWPVNVVGDDVSDLCVLCHQMKNVIDGGDSPTRNGLSGVHFNEGTNCLKCHNHGEEANKGL